MKLTKQSNRAAQGPQDGDDGEHDGATERRILDAAHTVFLRRGTAGARTQEIADEAGVNKALLHYYFRTKERLAEAVFHWAASRFLPSVLETLESDLSIAEKVAEVVRLELDHLSRHPYLPGYIISELHHHPDRMRQLVTAIIGAPIDDTRHRLFDKLQHQIDAGVRAGELRPIAPEQFIINLLSLCVFPFAARPMLMVMMGFDQAGFKSFIDRRRQELVPFFLAGLRP